MERHFISIWFFIGALLAVYGALILGVGIYDVYHPERTQVVMAHLHIQIWWGVAMLALGGTYVIKFRPGKR